MVMIGFQEWRSCLGIIHDIYGPIVLYMQRYITVEVFSM